VRRNFLVVAPSAPLREALAGDLRAKGYTVTRAANAKEAVRSVKSVGFDAVLVESHLPDMSPEELRKRIRRLRPDCRVVVLTWFDHVRNSPERLQHGSDEFLVDSSQLFDLRRAPYEVAGDEVSSFSQRGISALLQVVDVLVGLIELDDQFFGGSSHRATRLARAVAEELGSTEEAVTELVLATLLRDLGKVAVGSEIASDGSYSDEQKMKMREHVEQGVRMFEHIEFPWKVLPVLRSHHEHYDGSGYPDGLRGREIPMGARIVAVVDAFVAMTSDREYREAVDSEQALRELVGQSGKQFDSEIVEALQRVLDKTLVVRPAKHKPRVMIAEAQTDFRRLLKMRLLNEGLDVVDVDRATDVMGKILKNPVDLVLVDVDSDESEAFLILQELREDDKLRRVPFALLTDRSDRMVKLRALRQGVDEYLSKSEELDVLVARVQNVLTREAIRRDGGGRRARRGISGDLETLPVPDIVQMLTMGMKTASVTFTSNGSKGQMWFDNGAGKHAKVGRSRGEKAFFEMVSWTSGEFVIEHGIECKDHTLKQDAMFLLMEGMRLLDESRRDAQAAS
jgi:response regulator RpfG family c-di-GMP phosphodiesterase